ncbi:MAG: 50S ribosomal protein L24 [Turneriella sp.]|nr:50S ribosomal protein L24 [Leptospiraceae bacterium]MCX7633434.1 50S ribosomal protein L24 [Turneriella sp.]
MAAKRAPQKTKTRLKVNDEVIVIAGKFKKARGKILRIDREKNRVVVQGVNLRKRFARPTQDNPKGGVIEVEMPIAISNVQYYDAKEKRGTRIAYGYDKNQKKIRLSVASGRKRALD